MAQYANIPGVNMTVLEGQMMLGQDNTTNSILIIGDVNAAPRIDVAEGPVLVRNEEDLKENFGNYFYQGKVNPIAAEWSAAHRQGYRNIYLLALVGEETKDKYIFLQDALFNTVADFGFEQVVLTGLYANQDIEGLTAEDFGEGDIGEVEGVEAYHIRRATEDAENLAEAASLVINIKEFELPVSVLAGSPTRVINSLNDEVKKAIAENSAEVDVTFELIDGKAVVTATDSIEIVDGVSVLEALKLTDVVESLEGYGNAAALLGHYADKQAREVGDVLVYIGTSPAKSPALTDIRKHVDGLLTRRNEISRYVQVVAGPEVGITLPGSLRTQWVSGVTQYALLVGDLVPQVAPTNQVLPQASVLRYNLSLAQINRLSGHKYVTFRVKNNAITVVDGVTTAPDLYVGQDIVKSDYTRLSTVRIVNYITSRMREALDAYIGQPTEFAVYNSMRTTIKAEIKDAIDNLVIQDANFSIQLGDTLDSAVVKLTILPQFELRHIDVEIGLTTPDNFTAE